MYKKYHDHHHDDHHDHDQEDNDEMEEDPTPEEQARAWMGLQQVGGDNHGDYSGDCRWWGGGDNGDDGDDGDGVNNEVLVTGLSREIIANLLDFDTI